MHLKCMHLLNSKPMYVWYAVWLYSGEGYQQGKEPIRDKDVACGRYSTSCLEEQLMNPHVLLRHNGEVRWFLLPASWFFFPLMATLRESFIKFLLSSRLQNNMVQQHFWPMTMIPRSLF